MHWARFAPELSATVTMVLSWIISRPSASRPASWLRIRRARRRPKPGQRSDGSLGPLDEPDEAPALVLRDRAGLHETDGVAHVTLVLLVVHLEFRPAADVAAVDRMLHQALDGDDDRLLHAIAHHLADSRLSAVARFSFRGHSSPHPLRVRSPARSAGARLRHLRPSRCAPSRAAR